VVNSRFENNVGGGGGAIYNLLSELRVVDTAFVGNRGSSGWHGGGGIMTDGASANSGSGRTGGEILICGSSFDANRAVATGGGAYLYAYAGDRVSVTHSTFTGNSATANAGGLSMGGGLRLGAAPALVAHATFRNNSARTGGALATDGSAPTRIRNSTFACNSSDVAGSRVLPENNTMLGC
jgi:predicted outer membrane repeat protein